MFYAVSSTRCGSMITTHTHSTDHIVNGLGHALRPMWAGDENEVVGGNERVRQHVLQDDACLVLVRAPMEAVGRGKVVKATRDITRGRGRNRTPLMYENTGTRWWRMTCCECGTCRKYCQPPSLEHRFASFRLLRGIKDGSIESKYWKDKQWT